MNEEQPSVLRHSATWMRVLTETADAIQRTTSLAAAVAIIVQAGQQLGFARARLWLLNEANQTLEGAGHVGDDHLTAFIGASLPLHESSYTLPVLAQREPCVYHGQELGPWMLPQYFPEAHFVTPREDWVHLPLWTADRCWGVLTLDNAAQPCHIDVHQRLLLGLFARQVAAALSYVDLAVREGREHLTRRWLQQVVHITGTFQHAISIDDVATRIVQAARTLGFARARLWMKNEDDTVLLGSREIGNSGLDQFIGFALPCDQSPYVQSTLAARKPVLFVGEQLGPLVTVQHFRTYGHTAPIGQWVSIPLMLDATRCLGLLTCDAYDSTHPLSELHLDILDLLGRQAAAALERGRQQYDHHWLATLTELEHSSQELHTMDAVAKAIVTCGHTLGFARIRLWQYDEESGFLVGLQQIGEHCPDFADIWIPLIASSYGQEHPVEREPIFYTGRSESQLALDFFFDELGITPPSGEWASVPLWDNHRFIGLLELDDAEHIRMLHPGQRALLRLLGYQAAAALARMWLYERDQRHHDELSTKKQEVTWLTQIVTFANAAQQAASFQAIADTFTAGGCLLGFARARLWQLDDQAATLRCLSSAGDAANLQNFSIPLDQAVYANDILRSNTPLCFSSRKQPAFVDRYAASLKFVPPRGGWVGIPLHGSGHRPFGMLVLDYTEGQQPLSHEQRDLLHIFGQQAVVILEHARLNEAERQERFERSWLQRLAEVAADVQRLQTMDQFAPFIVTSGQTLGFARARLWHYTNDTLVGVAASGHATDAAFVNVQLPLVTIPYGRQLRTARQVFVCRAERARSAFCDQQLHDAGWEPPVGDWVEIPLYGGTQYPWGVLTLDSPTDPRLLHDAQHNLLALFQRHLDAALQRLRWQQHRMAMMEQLQALSAAPYEHGARGDQHQILEQIVKIAHRRLGADIVMLYPYDQQSNCFQDVITAGTILDSDTKIIASPNDQENIVQLIAERRHPFFIKDAQHDSHLVGTPTGGMRTFTVRQGIASFAGMPLIAYWYLLGVLCVNYRSAHDLDVYERMTLQVFMHQVSLVVASMQLTRAQERKRLRDDLHDTLQSDLLALHARLSATIEALAQQDVERARSLLHEAQRTSWGARTDLQIILYNRTQSDDATALAKVLHRRLDHVTATAGALHLHIDPCLPPLPTELTRELLFMLAEASVNARERGNAQHVMIHLRSTAGRLHVKVVDDGCGFDRTMATLQHGLGLKTMRERAATIDGTLRMRTAPGMGVTLRFDLPQRKAQRQIVHLRSSHRVRDPAKIRRVLWVEGLRGLQHSKEKNV